MPQGEVRDAIAHSAHVSLTRQGLPDVTHPLPPLPPTIAVEAHPTPRPRRVRPGDFGPRHTERRTGGCQVHHTSVRQGHTRSEGFEGDHAVAPFRRPRESHRVSLGHDEFLWVRS